MPLPSIACRIFLPIKAKGTGLLVESSSITDRRCIYMLASIAALD